MRMGVLLNDYLCGTSADNFHINTRGEIVGRYANALQVVVDGSCVGIGNDDVANSRRLAGRVSCENSKTAFAQQVEVDPRVGHSTGFVANRDRRLYASV